MAMVLQSKSVAGFNLSFFADEKELIDSYMTQIVAWLRPSESERNDTSNHQKQNRCLSIKKEDLSVFEMADIRAAHALIQSGKSTGKIIISTGS
mmetsp:Transcript_28038/g.38591  ORF Transcript_28038/g.38591 Transcript_28038/m.38591 type:complete len:94 (-) Transcript_28038:32-313(-)